MVFIARQDWHPARIQDLWHLSPNSLSEKSNKRWGDGYLRLQLWVSVEPGTQGMSPPLVGGGKQSMIVLVVPLAVSQPNEHLQNLNESVKFDHRDSSLCYIKPDTK